MFYAWSSLVINFITAQISMVLRAPKVMYSLTDISTARMGKVPAVIVKNLLAAVYHTCII
jgi:hypothetical protein